MRAWLLRMRRARCSPTDSLCWACRRRKRCDDPHHLTGDAIRLRIAWEHLRGTAVATRNNRQAVRNGGAAFPGWALFLAGVVVGLIVMALAYRGMPSLRRNDQPQANPNAVAQQGSSPGIAARSSAASSASQFDFYKVLPEKEVVIPNAELSAMAKAEQQKAAAANNASASAPAVASAERAASPAGGYVLQVGSFPDAGKEIGRAHV